MSEGRELVMLTESVHTCPLCLAWCVSYRGFVNASDLEDTLRDHLDTEHPGWTLETLKASLAGRP